MLFPNERSKFVFYTIAVGVLLVAAILVPLAFRSEPKETETVPATLEEKALLFSNYWEHGPEECGLGVVKIENPSRTMKDSCETRMRTMMARAIDDQELSVLSPTGSEYITLTDSEGKTVDVCRMWIEAKGDWQNWMDVCFDADTGDLFYLYLSRECQANKSRYETAAENLPTADSLSVRLAEEFGWTLRFLLPVDDYSRTAIYSTNSGTLGYDIVCKAYETLKDITIKCR